MNFGRPKHWFFLLVFVLLFPLILLFNLVIIFSSLLHPRTWSFDKEEAHKLLSEELAKFSKVDYDRLREMFVENTIIETRDVVGASGDDYQIEIEGFWDDKPDGDIRVIVSIDNGLLRAYSPLNNSFIMRPDGSLIE